MKVFQIVKNTCAWCTGFNSLTDAYRVYPSDLVFVEAPDYVFVGWGYKGEYDSEGNVIPMNERFTKPEIPEGSYYDSETGEVFPESELAERLIKAQTIKQNENKTKFAEYLDSNPLVWEDGKEYGITMEDQSEIQLNLTQYQLQVNSGVKDAVLEWHAKREKCTTWNIEDLTRLAISISGAVYPVFQKMNDYKEAIYSATDLDAVRSIEISYDPVVEENTAEDTTDNIEADTNTATTQKASSNKAVK